MNGHIPTLADILEIQASQVNRWCSVLNNETAAALRIKAAEENAKLTPQSDPYSVWRGQDIDTFLLNIQAK